MNHKIPEFSGKSGNSEKPGFKAGQIVFSKAGHDKGKALIVVISGVIGGRVFVADGVNRTSSKPKQKNPVHLSPTNTVAHGLGKLLEGGIAPRDSDIRRALDTYLAAKQENVPVSNGGS